jgi:ferredoxin
MAANQEITAYIQKLATTQGASHFGIVKMPAYYQASPSSFAEAGQLLTGVSIGVTKEDWILDGLPITDYQYRNDHYITRINRALQIGDAIAAYLVQNGHKAHRSSHPPSNGSTGLYKAIGNFAGLGWIGKNHLLVTPDRGPRVALGAVLTDAPLPVTANTSMPRQCGSCRRCIDICPVMRSSMSRLIQPTRLRALTRASVPSTEAPLTQSHGVGAGCA